MKFYYDLACSPPTYDAVSAACRAEIERQRCGADHIQMVILPGPAGGFRRDSLWPHSALERTRMLREVAMPIFMLLPSISSVTLAHERPTHGLGIGRRMYGLDQQVAASRKGIRPLRAPSQPRRRPMITMTLRECEHWPKRNSNVAQWAAAARILMAAGWQVVIVRDTLRADEPLEDLTTLPVASRKLFARAELYASAELNLFVSNGPAWLSLAMDLPTIIFRPGCEQLGKAFGRAHFERSGVKWGWQMPGSPAWQRLAWTDDTAAEIVNAVDDFFCHQPLRAAS